MTTKKKTSILTLIKEYALVTLGMLLYVLAWTVFLMPNNLVGGGISGLSAMIQYATNGVLKSGYTYFVINVVLLIIGLFTLGKQFGIKTVYAIVIPSVGLNVFQDLIPAEICQTLAVDNGKLISCMMGGALGRMLQGCPLIPLRQHPQQSLPVSAVEEGLDPGWVPLEGRQQVFRIFVHVPPPMLSAAVYAAGRKNVPAKGAVFANQNLVH